MLFHKEAQMANNHERCIISVRSKWYKWKQLIHLFFNDSKYLLMLSIGKGIEKNVHFHSLLIKRKFFQFILKSNWEIYFDCKINGAFGPTILCLRIYIKLLIKCGKISM